MPKGPRGGRTTTTAGGLRRKVLLLTEEIAEELRERAHRDRCSESEIARDALAAWLWPADEGEDSPD